MAIPTQHLALCYHRQFGAQCQPKQWLSTLRVLPKDPCTIQGIINGCFIHPWDHLLAGRPIPAHRQHEKQLRTVPALIAHCLALNPAPLTQLRPPQQRLMVTCRDFALTICAILKAHGCAARCRYAFNGYIWPDFYHDQIIVEYWSPPHNAWCRLDPRTSANAISQKSQCDGLRIEHINRMHCPLAAEVWLACRRQLADPDQFGAGLSKKYHGMGYIRNALIHDLAMMNHHVSLLWDLWGDMTEAISDKKLPLYDKLAHALCQGCPLQLSHYYTNAAFKPPIRTSPSNHHCNTVSMLQRHSPQSNC